MKYLLSFFLSVCFLYSSASYRVYLVHGYGSPKFVLNRIERNLNRNGFTTTNYGYPSRTEDLDKLGQNLYLEIKNSSYDTVCFVTHSMGALVVRSMLKNFKNNEKFPVVYRIVMIAPPNKGADIADLYVSRKLHQPFLGPNFKLMTTDSLSYANQLPIPVHSEVGIIVGIKGDGRGYNRRIKGENDGRLKPERTELGIEKDKAIFHDEHTQLTQDSRVIKLIVNFLKKGYFYPQE